MASPSQVLANRENARHSTGPRTPEGKRTSSFNALRHGITSKLTLLPSEDPEAYEALRAKLWSELNPKTSLEEALAQTVCENQWRLERARKAEVSVLALVRYEEVPAALQAIEDASERQIMLEAYARVKYDRALRNIQMQEARLQRLFTKSLADFLAERSRRRSAEYDAHTYAINVRTWHLANEKPFVPANHGFVFTAAELDAERERRHIQSHPMSAWGIPQIKTRADLESWSIYPTYSHDLSGASDASQPKN